jgi:hypothetical protein
MPSTKYGPTAITKKFVPGSGNHTSEKKSFISFARTMPLSSHSPNFRNQPATKPPSRHACEINCAMFVSLRVILECRAADEYHRSNVRQASYARLWRACVDPDSFLSGTALLKS